MSAARDSKFGPAEGGGALARRRRATGSGHVAETGEADTSPELIAGATDSSRQAQSSPAASVPEPHPLWKRQEWESASVEEMRDHLDAIGPPWGNPKLGAMAVVEAFWIAYEALDRLEKR